MKIGPKLSSAVLLASLSTCAIASDFNLPFINAAGLGNIYSGYAVSDDASTAYSNPAGLARLKNPQLVASGLYFMGNTSFHGTTTPPFPPLGPARGTAISKLNAFMGPMFFAMPVCPNVVIAFGECTPFGLQTNYSASSVARYSATRSKIIVFDVGPSVGVKINDKLSVGVGLDIDRLMFSLNSMYGPPFAIPDAQVQNNLRGWGYGFHAGVMYQLFECTRLGLSYNSQVMFHSRGESKLFSPVLGNLSTSKQRAKAALPALAQFSIQQDINQRLSLLGTVFYINWRALQYLTLQNTYTPFGTTTAVTIPFQYHNTFDYALGLNYKANECWTVRTGALYLAAPSNDRNRGLPDPIGKATIVAAGLHYQQNRCLGYDFSYAHSFFYNTTIHQVTPLASAVGRSRSDANIIGAQVTWDIV